MAEIVDMGKRGWEGGVALPEQDMGDLIPVCPPKIIANVGLMTLQ